MKFALLGDVHLRMSNPKSRIDEYYDEQFRKFGIVYEFARDTNCRAVLQPGDLFDHHSCPYGVVERYMRYINGHTCSVPIFGCLGQHDMRYHRTIADNTPIGVLYAGIERTGSRLLSSEPKVLIEQFSKTEVHIYGSSFGEEIPTIQNPSAINILVTHRMVTKDGPLWEGQEGNVEAEELLKQTKFRLIVSGDNHKHFTASHRMRYLVNCGSLMRSSIDQMDHKPCFYTYDTETNKIEKHPIRVKKAEHIFDLEKAVDQKQDRKELDDFIRTLTDVGEQGLSFKKNLSAHVDSSEYSDGVKSILSEIMEAL